MTMPMPEAELPDPPEQKGMWSWRVETSELDMHARSQPGWQLHYEQRSRGRFAGLVHHVMLPGVRLVLERCNVAVRQTGLFPEGHHVFALALESEAPAIFNGQRVDPGAFRSVPVGRAAVSPFWRMTSTVQRDEIADPPSDGPCARTGASPQHPCEPTS